MKHFIRKLLNRPHLRHIYNNLRPKSVPIHNALRPQQGRSMVEMLGVLAVIGVLSITAILGYSYAMNKHRANVILNDVKRIAVFVISSDFMQKENGVIEDLNVEVESATPYEVDKETEKTFYITAGEVGKKICAILVREKPAYVEEVVANAMDSKVCQEGENEIYFYVNGDMQEIEESDKPEACSVEVPCDSCSDCVAGRCISKKCQEGQVCKEGICSKCAAGSFDVTGTGSCKKCDDLVAYGKVSTEECHSCRPTRYSRSSELGTCISCQLNTSSINMDIKAECDRCPNRVFMGNEGAGTCMLCKGAIDNIPATLVQCNLCANRYFDIVSKTCKRCPTGQVKNVAGTGCES